MKSFSLAVALQVLAGLTYAEERDWLWQFVEVDGMRKTQRLRGHYIDSLLKEGEGEGEGDALQEEVAARTVTSNNSATNSHGIPFGESLCTDNQGVDCYGDDLDGAQFYGITSHDDCCALCGQHPGCNAWTWQDSTEACYLKSACSNRRSDSNCHSSPTPPPSPTPPSPALCTDNQGVDCFGDDLDGGQFSGISSHDDCCALCGQHPGCNAWTWQYSTEICYLKSACSNRRSDSNCHSSPTPPPSPPAPFPTSSPTPSHSPSGGEGYHQGPILIKRDGETLNLNVAALTPGLVVSSENGASISMTYGEQTR